MAKNLISEGKIMPFTCTADIESGKGLKIGQTFGVTAGKYSNGDTDCQMYLTGVWELKKKTADTPAVGAKLYWDDTLKELTTTVGTNKLVAVAWEAAGGSDTVVKARLIQNGL